MPRGGGYGSGQKTTRRAVSRLSGSTSPSNRGSRARYRGTLKALTIGKKKKKKK